MTACGALTWVHSLQFKKDATTIMSAIHKATDLLQPVDSSTVSLQDVAPSFSACFDFDYSESPSLNFVVEMVSSAADPTIYDRAYAVWTRKDRRDNAVPLEAFTARVDGFVPGLFPLI